MVPFSCARERWFSVEEARAVEEESPAEAEDEGGERRVSLEMLKAAKVSREAKNSRSDLWRNR